MKILDLPQRIRERRLFGFFDDFEWFLSPHLWTSFATGSGGAGVAMASGMLYVGELSSGMVIGYSFPWRETGTNGVVPLIAMDSFPFKKPSPKGK